MRNLGIAIARFHLESPNQMRLFEDCPENAEPARAANHNHTRQRQLDEAMDDIRARFGFRSVLRGPSLDLLEQLPSDGYGFVLRTPCLTR